MVDFPLGGLCSVFLSPDAAWLVTCLILVSLDVLYGSLLGSILDDITCAVAPLLGGRRDDPWQHRCTRCQETRTHRGNTC